MAEDFFVRSNDITNINYGKPSNARSVDELLHNGIIILDKWPGPTSHDVAATVKRIFSLARIGHSGTLDPAVSGVLPLALENACKIIPALQHLDKSYVGVMRLHKDVSDEKLNDAISKFIGEITQLPPRRSAVARRERMRKVYAFDILDRIGRDVAFMVECEAGTYVRKLVSDIGKPIGGAHMAELRRTGVGRFGEYSAVKMQDLVDAYEFWKQGKSEAIKELVLPVEEAVAHLGKIIVKDSAVAAVVNGSPLYTHGVSMATKGVKKGDMVAVMTLKGELVALAIAAMDSEQMMGRGTAAKIDRVIMAKGTYPK